MRSFFTLKFSWKGCPGWLRLVFHFGTENGEGQLKKPPCMTFTQTLPQSRGTEGKETTKNGTICWPQRCRPRCWNQILYTPWSFLKVVGSRQLRVEQWLDQLALEEKGLEGVGSDHRGVGGVNEALEETASRQEKGKREKEKSKKGKKSNRCTNQ